MDMNTSIIVSALASARNQFSTQISGYPEGWVDKYLSWRDIAIALLCMAAGSDNGRVQESAKILGKQLIEADSRYRC